MINKKIAIIGLGYVGLPLAVAFSNYFKVVGFDNNKKRIGDLLNGLDITNELSKPELKKLKKIKLTSDQKYLNSCNIYIVTVPTPIDKLKKPDLKYLISASTIVGKYISKGDIVIYESTVYPGATEGDCVPILEKYSGLKFNHDFFCGYSPERINPGDKKNNLKNIKKITSGSTPNAAEFIDKLYLQIIDAGTYKASSIKIAEAAKVIENIQRDVNIALVNELSIIFNALEIDTEEVLEAAATKWNFIKYKPGLVGGHCISVDPYYLTHKAKSQGILSQVILAGRKVNDNMASHIVNQLIKYMVKKEITINKSNILIMGFTFKENCNDLRNTMVSELVLGLKEYNCNVDIFEPWIDIKETKKDYKYNFVSEIKKSKYDGIILAVAHDKFKDIGIKKIRKYGKSSVVIYDLKHIFNKEQSDLRL
jgi:UDP-N-acetyl-D-glucosamine/UDP-N-acetyl-D-galactosamine dehydrogenase